MKIQNTNNVNENKLKIIINGQSGAGKTTQASKLEKYKPLVISYESGLLSLAGSNIDYIDGSKDTELKLIASKDRISQLMEIYKYTLSKECIEKYNTLYIDSLTEICQCMFDSLKAEFPDRKDNLVLYGELSQKMRALIKAFRDIPHYHNVFTCLSKVEKDESGKRYMGFDLIGSIADKLPQFVDEVLYLKVNEDSTRSFICNSTDSIICKDRSGKLDLVEPADLGLIFDKILTTKEEKK